VRAITIWRPWANWIALWLKTWETRTHKRLECLVGERIAIHAAKRYDADAGDLVAACVWGCDRREGRIPFNCTIALAAGRYVNRKEYETGIVAVASAIEFRKLTIEDAPAALCPTDGLWGLRLDRIKRIEPAIPCRGAQGIWNVPPDVEATVRRMESRS